MATSSTNVYHVDLPTTKGEQSMYYMVYILSQASKNIIKITWHWELSTPSMDLPQTTPNDQQQHIYRIGIVDSRQICSIDPQYNWNAFRANKRNNKLR